MKKVQVDEEYQKGYEYRLTEPVGKNFGEEFTPELTPKQMLSLGVFGGNYFSETPSEFPKDWFESVRYSKTGHGDKSLNYYRVNASQPLEVWQQKGWIYPEDPKGWFLWYFRYYMGRRIPEEDKRQIKRWKNFKRHVSQVKKYCTPGDVNCRPRQRQALLHWAYDSRNL
ncbi:hypothetical protein KC950_02515 [Candidatus Saccharibacteria bacterium]|nr:hypothetical protein [Candidatus Saccharibacteria bacterium]